jgi:hypothetical protein
MQTYKFKRQGSRRMGRPRLRWTEDVENDHRMRKGKQKAVYREELAVCNLGGKGIWRVVALRSK